MYHVPPGSVLSLSRDDWSPHAAAPGTYHVFLRVTAVRHETAVCYRGRWVWVDGVRLDRDGSPLGDLSLLLRRGALRKTRPSGKAW